MSPSLHCVASSRERQTLAPQLSAASALCGAFAAWETLCLADDPTQSRAVSDSAALSLGPFVWRPRSVVVGAGSPFGSPFGSPSLNSARRTASQRKASGSCAQTATSSSALRWLSAHRCDCELRKSTKGKWLVEVQHRPSQEASSFLVFHV